MKKSSVVCIFAHPDDESFGPSGTIAKLAQDNNVYIICVTDGDAGENDDHVKDLGEVRTHEARKAAKILGVSDIFFLEYNDGKLSNSIYHEVAAKIKKILEEIKPSTLLTFEPHGISGHIDHITVSMISSYLFEHLDYIKKIMYYCQDEERERIRKTIRKDYFVFFPPGYKKSEIDEVIDVEDVWDTKLAAVNCHVSQADDLNFMLEYHKKIAKEECFLIKEKQN